MPDAADKDYLEQLERKTRPAATYKPTTDGHGTVFVLSAGGLMLQAWVVSSWWNWFLVPRFHWPGVSALDVLVAVIILRLALSFSITGFVSPESRGNVGEAMGRFIIFPLLIQGLGFLIKQFV